MREREVEGYFVRRIKERGGVVRKAQWVGVRGCPDRAVFLPGGRFYLVELKRPGGVPEPHQAREHTRLWKLGHRVVVIDSPEAVDTFLNGVPAI